MRFLAQHPEFLYRHPELIAAAEQYAETNRRRAQRGELLAVLKRNRALLDDSQVARLGAADADLIIIEFSDYRCAPCRDSAMALRQLLAEDSRLSVRVLPLPLFGQEAVYGARAALAANQQGQFAAMHDWLFAAPQIDRRSVLTQADAMHLDIDRFLQDMNDKHIAQHLITVQQLANDLRIDGVPAMIVGDLLVRGGVDAEGLRRSIKVARCLAPLSPGDSGESTCLEQSREN